jgi:hypothetical protein
MTNNKRGGFYWKNNNPYISVTHAIDILNKPQLTYWYGQQVYLSMVKNPSLTEKEAMAEPYKTSEKAKDRGTLIHSLVESWKVTRKEIETVPELYRPYAEAFYSFVTSTDIVPIEHEKTVFSEKYKFAGTLDLLAKRGNETLLIDVKTSKDGNIYDEVTLQTSAYKQALLEEGIKIDRVYALALSGTGKPTFKELDDNFKAFRACQILWAWKNKDKCEKLDYKLV